ncbi:MAG: SPASM domain-containing protein [Holosporaceae bacterium]|jgi:MoaA/NifB/PqqE/SkfB family radical SAM enzyme|nr:SPASM domain-containing protein [Holosporaceae bacterium]
MSDAVKNTVINELIPHATQLELQGTGESLLYDGLCNIINAAKKYQCELIIITSASLLDKEKMLMLANAECQIIISMDSAIKSTYEKIRINGDFDSVCANIDYWKYVKNSLPSDNKSFLSINMVMCSLNYTELIEMIDFAIVNGAEYLFVTEIRPCAIDKSSWNSLNLQEIKKTDDFQKLIAEVKAYAQQKNFRLVFNFMTDIEKEYKRNICCSPWEHVFVFASGDVSVCCEVPMIFGNLNKSDFDSIWNGEKLNKFRASMAIGDYSDRCKTCCLPWGITMDS